MTANGALHIGGQLVSDHELEPPGVWRSCSAERRLSSCLIRVTDRYPIPGISISCSSLNVARTFIRFILPFRSAMMIHVGRLLLSTKPFKEAGFFLSSIRCLGIPATLEVLADHRTQRAVPRGKP